MRGKPKGFSFVDLLCRAIRQLHFIIYVKTICTVIKCLKRNEIDVNREVGKKRYERSCL